MDLPMFRRGNVHSFLSSNDNRGVVLTNTHEGLKPSGVQGGEVSLVQGIYGYHHYLQDGFDDSGWGCAYRSLQTIFSWFRWDESITYYEKKCQDFYVILYGSGIKVSPESQSQHIRRYNSVSSISEISLRHSSGLKIGSAARK